MTCLLEVREDVNNEVDFFSVLVIHFLVLHRSQEVRNNAFLHLGKAKVDKNTSLSLL